MHHRENTLLSWRQPLLTSLFPPSWCQLSASVTFQADGQIPASTQPSGLAGPAGERLRNPRQLPQPCTISFHSCTWWEKEKNQSKRETKSKSVPDTLYFFFLIVICFSLIQPTTEPGVFFLLNLDQFIALAEKCYVTADTWKIIWCIVWQMPAIKGLIELLIFAES